MRNFTENISKLGYSSLETTGDQKANRASYLFRTQRDGTILFTNAGRQTIMVKTASKPKDTGPKGSNGIVANGSQKGLQGFVNFIVGGQNRGISRSETRKSS